MCELGSDKELGSVTKPTTGASWALDILYGYPALVNAQRSVIGAMNEIDSTT